MTAEERRQYNNAKARRWAQRNPDRIKASNERQRAYQVNWTRTWRIENPDLYKVQKEQWKDYKTQWAREWRRQNPDIACQANQIYRSRRAAATVANCSSKIKELKQSKICHWCKQPMDVITIDHIIPIFRGGKHSPENLVAACKTCNFSKGSKLVSEWRRTGSAQIP